ncbi:lysine--tRNA ligase [Actinopolymorpha alba]|uniref:lysine--tRNA ligase n=1 Tax=Actinopolymorpha alba TaxID=533267 RepID=UPI0003827E7E|nr:lysine--tRNA ligase [Actinopolymorpha alba]
MAAEEESLAATEDASLLETIRTQRIDKIHKLREAGIEPYPSGPVDKTAAADALKLPDGAAVTIAGRIMLFRVMGNIAFGRLHDESGDIQFVLSRKELDQAAAPESASPEVGFKFWVRNLDLGDFVAIEGERMETRTGERSVNARRVTLLSKSLRPLPDKHAGLNNEDVLLRKRYLDILLHREVQEMIYKKARFWRSIRRFLEDRAFVEVQTPALEHTTGGADARPFVTHHNYLGTDVCLRISMGELWQKRLLVGGLEKVFEIGRQFRNENQSREHLNDYDQMEFYWAYANYEWGMQLVQELFIHTISETFGTLQFTLHRNGREYVVDLGAEWQRYDYVETVAELTGVNVLEASTAELVAKLDELEVPYDKDGLNHARAMDALWKHCRRQLTGPGFLVNEPLEVSPLAKRNADRPGIVERFHVVIAGSELGNGYSELNDPVDQAERFAEQQALREAGDSEAQMADDEFVEALEYAMPPACGFGMSERVFAFFMDKSIRECQIFPLLKPAST